MEQLAARRAHNPKVAGSSPAPATNVIPMPNKALALLGISSQNMVAVVKRSTRRIVAPLPEGSNPFSHPIFLIIYWSDTQVAEEDGLLNR